MRKDTISAFIFFKCSLYAAILFICCIFSAQNLLAQDPAQYGTPFSGVPDLRDVTMYQVNTRAFSSTKNFAGVTARLDSIKALGINVIYLMPVYPVGTVMSSNSPYCITNFKGVGTEFGTLTDLRSLVDGAHSRNMAVILDFVVNQTAWDHPWTTSHKTWYHRDGSGNILNFNSYPDVAALDLGNDSVKKALDSSMRYWVFAANVDGFRCDFADNPVDAFWTFVLADLRTITTHNLILMAEGTRSTNYADGFDYNFGTQCYYNSFKPIFSSGSPATTIDNSNTVEYSGSSGNKQIIRFLTNHDVNGAEGTPLTLFGGHAGSMATFVVAAYMKGIPFVYNGQEVDFNTQITYPFTSVTIDWTTNYSAEAEYKKIIAYRNSSAAVRRGTLTSYTNNDVCAFKKVSGTETVVVLSNLRNSTINFTLPSGVASTTWYDAYTGASVALGTSISLSAYQYKVYTNVNPLTPVTSVSVTTTTSSLAVGSTVQLTATVLPSTANQSVTWTTSNSTVATVSSTGLVSAVGAGAATITVTTVSGGLTATSTITASVVSVTGVSVTPTTNSLGVGSTVQLTATVAPTNATNKNVTWSSSNTAVATVNSTGLVTAVAAGTATITVTTVDGSHTATATITSSVIAVTGVTVSPTTSSINVGGTTQLTATVAPANATNKNVTWSSSNTAIATVNSTGLVTAVAAGTATITVTTVSGAHTATSTFTISSVPTFTVHFYRPSTWGTTIKIYWWSALPVGNLADGTWPGVNMTANGNNWYSYTFTNITSTNLIFNDGTNQTANLSQSANAWYEGTTWYSSAPTPVTGVTVSPATATIAAAGTQTLTPTIAPSTAVNQNVSWSSSNTGVATVSSAGIVTGVAAGTATITVTTQDGSFTATSTITVSAGLTTYYNIVNRWQSTDYLYDGGTGKVLYGTSPGTNTTFQWAQVSAGSGYIYLKNRSTGNIMHVEDQSGWVECATGNTSWYSAMWSVVDAGSGYSYLENRWMTSEWIHMEHLDGYAEYSGATSGWYSAMWQFVNPVSGKQAQPEPIANEQKADAIVFPNPADADHLNVMFNNLPDNEVVTLTLRNTIGQTVLEKQMTASGQVDHSLPTGMYIVNIRSTSLNVTQKLIVR